MATKPAFRESFRAKRCLIPCSGFHEWKAEGKVRRPYHIRMTGEGLFALAGLWQFRTDGRQKVTSCAQITRTPTAVMTGIHDRMPVILTPGECAAWLDPQTRAVELAALLRPGTADRVGAFRVSRYVSKAGNEGPRCVEPLTEAAA